MYRERNIEIKGKPRLNKDWTERVGWDSLWNESGRKRKKKRKKKKVNLPSLLNNLNFE